DAVSRDRLVEPPQPPRARRGRRRRPRARRRRARQALARRRADAQEAQHVHRLHRLRRAPRAGGLHRARPARGRGRERGRPPGRRGAEHAARPLHGGGPARTVPGRDQHDARPVAPADGRRVRGVGQPEAPRALRVHGDLLPVHAPGSAALPGDPRAHRAQRHSGDVRGGREVDREAPGGQDRRPPAAPQGQPRGRARRRLWPLRRAPRARLRPRVRSGTARSSGLTPGGTMALPGETSMRVLLVHPSPLLYSEIYLRLEPLGLERVAAALRAARHDVRVLDLQIFGHREYFRELETFRLDDLDRSRPARERTRRRRKYFIGVLDPCASAEFTRGCPWDCSFCSAWTFYGRSYRKASPEAAAEDIARITEPNVFLVDDVAFVQAEHGYAIGREIERRGIRKAYYLETRCDVLL